MGEVLEYRQVWTPLGHALGEVLYSTSLQPMEAQELAVRAFEEELGHDVPTLVQPVVSGVEIALGITRDPQFGPLVMVAAGGVATNILDDRTFLMPPFSRRDAAAAIRSLRIWPMLDGYRGTPRTDVDGLEATLVALGSLATEVPEVAELDLNPVMCTSDGPVLVDVKVRLAAATPVDAGVPRRLRDAGSAAD